MCDQAWFAKTRTFQLHIHGAHCFPGWKVDEACVREDNYTILTPDDWRKTRRVSAWAPYSKGQLWNVVWCHCRLALGVWVSSVLLEYLNLSVFHRGLQQLFRGLENSEMKAYFSSKACLSKTLAVFTKLTVSINLKELFLLLLAIKPQDFFFNCLYYHLSLKLPPYLLWT